MTRHHQGHILRLVIAMITLTFPTSGLCHGLQNNIAWIEFSPVGGNFTVLLPTKPSLETNTIELLTDYSYTAETDWVTYEVGYTCCYPKMLSSVDDALELMGNTLNLGYEGRFLTKKKITLNGYTGREFEFITTDGNLKVMTRLYLVGKRIYRVRAVITPANLPADKDIAKFFSSFNLTKSPRQQRQPIVYTPFLINTGSPPDSAL